jgi:hypothetical protein
VSAKVNKVAPTGEVVAIDQRGSWMGNRGALTKGGEAARQWQVRRWITCRLEFRGWRAPAYGTDNRYTPLFFLDEAVALAAGHRPCAECRHADFVRWRDAWADVVGPWTGVDDADRRMHADRLDGGVQRTHRRPWRELPAGSFAALDDGRPARVEPDRLLPWVAGPAGYDAPVARPASGDATVLTPSCTVDVLLAGYRLAEVAPARSG